MEEKEWEVACMHCSLLLRADLPGPAASSSDHCNFPSGKDCVLNKPFLPVRLCYHSNRKINQDSGHCAHELGVESKGVEWNTAVSF